MKRILSLKPGLKSLAPLCVLFSLFTTAWLPTNTGKFPSLSNPVKQKTGIEPVELNSFFDELIPGQLTSLHIPGAVVTVVKNGKVVFEKGYGYADIDQKSPVRAQTTLFRTGSVAKLFVWTAVMQLVEKGELDLHEDINHYLKDFQIPLAYREPITMFHLMTHTAGFEDGPIGLVRPDTNSLEPLGDFLAHRIPARVFQPGEITAYSNYGAALAGYIVENISGQNFDEYVEANILNPLGMTNTTFRQPVPEPLANSLAKGYIYTTNTFIEQPFEVYEIAPAGAASATAADMAKFMLAHLSGGSLQGKRILTEESEQEMLHKHFANDPRLTGIAFGFYQTRLNNLLVLTHAGDTSYFHTQVFLLPEENFGMYVAYNSAGGVLARQDLAHAFFDRFFTPGPKMSIEGIPVPAGETLRFAGMYISTRSNQSTLEKTRWMFDPRVQPARILANSDGLLRLIQPLELNMEGENYSPKNWLALQPNVYQSLDSMDTLVFHTAPSGEVRMFMDSNPLRGFRKLAWFEEILFQLWFPGISTLLLIGLMIFGLKDKHADKTVRWMTVAAGITTLIFFLGLAGLGLLAFMPYLYGQIHPVWYAIFALPVVLGGLVIGLPLAIWKAGTTKHLPYLGVVFSGLALLVWINYWNLLGWRF